MSKRNMMMNVLLTLGFALMMAVGQVVLSSAAIQIFDGAPLTVTKAMSNRFLWLGIVMYALSLGFWLYILSRFDVRYAYPIASTAIVFAALITSVMNRDFPSGRYWFGLACVIVGIAVISGSSQGKS